MWVRIATSLIYSKGGNEMLNTNLKHLETEQEVKEAIENNENVMVCCGRMGPMCIPVYAIMEDLGIPPCPTLRPGF
jgi:hypothetical protein